MINENNKEKPTYYGILPAAVRYDERLKPMEKIMYSEITALSNKDGYCSAKNGYFAGLYSVSKPTVSRWISNLSDCGYVRVNIIRDGSKNVIDRMIFPIDTPIDEKINRVLTKKSIAYCEKDQHPIDEKRKENNTSTNTTRENKPAPAKKIELSDKIGHIHANHIERSLSAKSLPDQKKKHFALWLEHLYKKKAPIQSDLSFAMLVDMFAENSLTDCRDAVRKAITKDAKSIDWAFQEMATKPEASNGSVYRAWSRKTGTV